MTSRQEHMREKVLKTIRTYGLLSRGDRCILAVSGGADSMALLYVLFSFRDELGIELRAVHVHHGLRGAEADRDASWVQESCGRLGIPCEVRYVDVREYVRETGTSVEEGARILRYEALFDAARAWDAKTETSASGYTGDAPEGSCTKIAVAHNLNDDAETILMQMARGSGLRGIGGISARNGRIIRPLLHIKRSEIEEYLTQAGISWVTDSTNLDDEYTRNRIRHRVLPELEAGVNSAAPEHIAAAGEMIYQAYEYMRDSAQRLIREYAILDACTVEPGSDIQDRETVPYSEKAVPTAAADVKGGGKERAEKSLEKSERKSCARCRFPVDVLRGQPQIMRGTIVLMLIERICGTRKDISSVHVSDIVSLIDKETGKRIMLPYGLLARREYEVICIEKHRKAAKPGAEKADINVALNPCTPGISKDKESDISRHFHTRILPYHGESVPVGEYTKWLDYDKISNSVAFRCRQPGDYIMLGGTGHKSVAAYMTDRKIPAARRDSIPLAADGSHIMWIVGYRISEQYKVTQTTKNVLELRYIADEGETDG